MNLLYFLIRKLVFYVLCGGEYERSIVLLGVAIRKNIFNVLIYIFMERKILKRIYFCFVYVKG